jgi:hypothetical protein
VLYSHTYYTAQQFWALYDRPWYEGLRKKYGATTLPSLYDTVHVDVGKSKREYRKRKWTGRLAGVWPIAGCMGILAAIKSKDYLIHRKPCWTYWKGAGASLPRPTEESEGYKGTL